MGKIYYVVAHHDDAVFKENIKPYLPMSRTKIIKDNPKLNTMSKKYNEGRRRLKNIRNNDIVIFIHEDIKVLDSEFEARIKYGFQINPDLGVLGVYGSTAFVGGGWWTYEKKNYAVGQIIQGLNNGKQFYMRDNPTPFRKDLVVIDGCMMAVRGELLKKQEFDETLKGWHHYDNTYCLNTLLNTDFKVGVIGSKLLHVSEGNPDELWSAEATDIITDLVNNKGLTLPITYKSIQEWKKNGNTKFNKQFSNI